MNALPPERNFSAPRSNVPAQIGALFSACSHPLTVCRFDTAFPKGPALGTVSAATWGNFTTFLQQRREGGKDGPNFVPATFTREPDGRVRRLGRNLVSRTAIVLDCETNQLTGEIPLPFAQAVEQLERENWAAAIYTSHSHTEQAPRYRIVLPLSEEIAPELPAVEIVAERLHLLGVLDKGKAGAASLFYLPSCPPRQAAAHDAEILDGRLLDAGWLHDRASEALAAQEAERARQRAIAREAAGRSRAEPSRQGFDQEASIIEAVRSRLDLEDELLDHGYEKVGDRFLFKDSRTGVPGVYILNGDDGVERAYSHHSGDPLAAGNLPSWCTVKAVDAVDVITILDYGADRRAALRALAERFGLSRPKPEPPEQKQRSSKETEPAEAAASTLNIIDPTTLFGVHVPEREWIVQGWLPVGAVTALFGDGGTGKTLLGQQLMTACATKTPWCGLAVTPCRSLGLFCEDDREELHRRQNQINEASGLNFGALGAMQWLSGVGADNALVSFVSDGRMIVTPRFTALKEAALAREVRLFVLDTAADLFAGNENDRHQVRQFISLLSGLAVELKGAVLLNAHPSRTGLSSGNLDGGSTAWNNGVRSRWSLARPAVDGEDAQPDTNERILTRRKANYASIGDTIQLRWVSGVLAPVTREGGVLGSISRQAVEQVFVTLLDRCREQGVFVSHSRNAGNFAPKVFAKHPDRDGYGRADFDQAMSRLFAAREIRVENYPRSRGHEAQRIARQASGGLE